ncbi:hypothetical protein NM688_g347 [Phlebia brevispora]|uniref:Uncharacterized protein n=1 Tax=Phlebia brevispora TaxID=194682 RepID=A0ACC1TER7_9APHY|nr:hypothetical protein NM688_g347 [Phlebia brevispora]
MSSEHTQRTHVPSAKQRQIEDARAEKIAVNQAKRSKAPRNNPSEVQKWLLNLKDTAQVHLAARGLVVISLKPEHSKTHNRESMGPYLTIDIQSPIHLQHADPNQLFDNDHNFRSINLDQAHASDFNSDAENIRARKKHREASPEGLPPSDEEPTANSNYASSAELQELLYDENADYSGEEAEAGRRSEHSDRASSPNEDDRRDIPTGGSQLSRHRSLKSADRKAETDPDEAVIELAWETYEVYCASDCLFSETDSKVETHLVHASWKEACTNLDQLLKMTPKEFKMIAWRATHFRSESKKVAHTIIAQMYGFQTGQSVKTKDFNIAHAAKLKNDRAFMHPASCLVLSDTSDKRIGLYRNRAIGQFFNVVLFKKNSRLGVVQSHLFRSAMPIPTMAYALTMLEYGISEWSTGYFEDTTFRISDWKLPYYTHIEDLKKFEERTAQLNMYKRIAGKLLENARSRSSAHAGVGPVRAPTYVSAIAEEVFDNELAAYEAGELKSDDEDGSSDDSARNAR